jgi:hypothetical protein
VKRPFTTPTPSDYSTNKTQPDILHSKPGPPGQPPGEAMTPLRNPFDVNGPIDSPQFGSPPPLDKAAKKENQNPQLLLSPGPAPVRRLDFD